MASFTRFVAGPVNLAPPLQGSFRAAAPQVVTCAASSRIRNGY